MRENLVMTSAYPIHRSVQTFGEGRARLCKGGDVGVQDRQLAVVYNYYEAELASDDIITMTSTSTHTSTHTSVHFKEFCMNSQSLNKPL